MQNKTFIATTRRGIARALAGNDNEWRVEHLLDGQRVNCLAADPHTPSVVYAGTQGDGLLRSDDGGETWKPAGLDGHVVKSVTVSPSTPGVIYAGTKPPLVFVSRDDSASWTELESFRRIPSRKVWFSPAEPPGTAYVQAITLPVDHPDVVLAGIEFGAVVRSEDGGQTWKDHRKGAVRDCHTMTGHVTHGNWVYEGGGSGNGAAFSTDAGATWTQPRKGLDRHYGWAVAADPARPEVWYVSVSPGPGKAHSPGKAEAHVYRSMDGGAWEKLGGGLPDPLMDMPYALLTDPAAPGHFYAGLSNGDVWRSADYGDNWQQLPFNLTGIHRSLILL